ncbi:FixJ family two-component response regulator [Rhodoblastus acidophilus]|nr:FixJ family two-component response regulator [Rhodoblastus acidophilus]
MSPESDLAADLAEASGAALRGQIEAAIVADPSRSDQSIARELGCSPTTVGKVRASIGLGAVARSVQRGGQMFSARYHHRSRHESMT